MAVPIDELRIRLLGGLDVDGLRPTDIGSRKARTLLALLALAQAPVSPDAVADAVWGDERPSRPLDQVAVLVSRLRGALGSDRLLREDAGYVLRADWIDVRELRERADAAQAHLAGGDPVSARLAAAMALDLVRGALLPHEDGDWVAAPRAQVTRIVGSGGLVAAEAALAVGDALGAAAAAAHTLDGDPYDEAALRALMRAHVVTGRPASALAAYAEVRQRLLEDLGVSPEARTEALHAEILGVAASAPSPPDRFDPLLQRARSELASTDVGAARRDAEEAVRRGGGPAALEAAGWMAYYDRDLPAALRWAEQAAASATEPERRVGALSLAGRVRHSHGDLPEAERLLEEAVQGTPGGARSVAEVWLGDLRAHQGRPAEAHELAVVGATDAATLRHPFVIVHSYIGQTYALGQQGRVADALATLDEWDAVLDDLGPVGVRYRPVALNFRSWMWASIGRRAEAAELSTRAIELTESLEEARMHAVLDLARLAVDQGDATAAAVALSEVEPPSDHSSTMAWHQRQRLTTLQAEVALLSGDLDRAEALASEVERDAAARSSRRAEVLAAVVVTEARARAGRPVSDASITALLEQLAPVAGLERWRAAARLAAATGSVTRWSTASRWADELARACGSDAARVAAWLSDELARYRT